MLYWLPALINKGRVKPSPRFLEVINETSEAFQMLAKHVDVSGRLHLNTSLKAASGYAPDVLGLATKMLCKGRQLGMAAAVKAGYPGHQQAQLQKRFTNSSFSFLEFLEHVVWTWQVGVVDPHWAPISQLCNPCRANYRYVLHLENPQESSFLLGLLQIQVKTVPRKHVSIGTSPDQLDLRYYTHVPRDLMAKIFNMYWVDFNIFGYDKMYI